MPSFINQDDIEDGIDKKWEESVEEHLIINIDHYNTVTLFFYFDPFLIWVGSLNKNDKLLEKEIFFVPSFALYVILNKNLFDNMSLSVFSA